MERRTAEYIRDNALLAPGERVVCALSGGCDSVCLLLLLTKLAGELGLAGVSALHVNHGIRGEEAERDEAFCRELCERLGVPLTVRHEDIPKIAAASGESLEEAGRRRRLEIFAEEAKARGAKVAAAHHLNDQAETLLMSLARGTGPAGLAGMRPLREDARGFTLIRPLLRASREEIEAYAAAQGTGWCEDSTNASGENSRSRLRAEVLPVLEDLWPGAARHAAALAAKLAAQEDFLDRLAGEAMEKLRRPDGSLDADALRREDPVLRQRIFALWLEENGGLKDVGEVHYAALEDLLSGQSGRKIRLPGGRTVLLEQTGLRLISGPARRDGAETEENTPADLSDRFETRVFPAGKNPEIQKKQYTKQLDYDTINGTLCFRTRRKGDYLTLPGGGRQSLQDFFVNEKIPSGRRDRVPLAADGSHILWIVGYRISEAAKITDNTKTIIEIKYGGDHEETSSGRSDQQ